jgi:hypothetical protein
MTFEIIHILPFIIRAANLQGNFAISMKGSVTEWSREDSSIYNGEAGRGMIIFRKNIHFDGCS